MRLTVRIATRGSALALWQANHVADLLRRADPSVTVELTLRATKGDRVQDRPLHEVGGKGLFVKEIEAALLAGEADLAVHSMKDVPTEEDPRLALVAFPTREDPRDALLSGAGLPFDELPAAARVGTSSIRRAAQLRARRPGLALLPLRGNVDTRVAKLDRGELDAVVLACAGLGRLGLAGRITARFPVAEMVPCGGQGAIGIQMRAAQARPGDPLLDLVRAANHAETETAVRAERAFLALLKGGCRSPIGAHLERAAEGFRFHGLVAEPDGSAVLRETLAGGPESDPADLAAACARRLLEAGAESILEKTRDREVDT